ncbi:MAG: response regulator [Synergistaceae bacterium]|jgi:signal transduction histidine kinase/response regulator of citrate/malate metabolism|nr:response regulator [Synergistaceae bacterium]
MIEKVIPERRYFYIVCFLAFCVILFGGITYSVTSQTLKQQMGRKCLGIASAVSAILEENPEEYRKYIESLDTGSDYYIRTKALIEKIRFGNVDNIAFLYTEMRASEDKMMYLFDGEKSGTDTFAPPGSMEPLTPARRAAYESRSAYIGDFTPVVWGMLLSAYAPVFNRNTGEFLGIVGADVSIEQYNVVMREQFIVIVGSAVITMVMGYLLLRVNREKIHSDEENFSKTSFLARMSHEIRTPLNAVVGLSEVELQNDLPENTLDNLGKIYNSGLNLLSIVNDILDISKIESGKFELVPVQYSVASLIGDAVQLNILRIAAKPVTFDLSLDETIPDSLCGDETRLKQILSNLLSNAFKYTKEGRVELELKWERRDDSAWLTFVVSDTGSGIEKKNIDKLFSEYYRADIRKTRNIEGTGLGLPITKNLVELMGGTITVESEYGQGSVFSVKIRQEIVDETPIGHETVEKLRHFRFMESRSVRGKTLARRQMPYGRVLVVDDVPVNLDVARGLMLPYDLMIDCVSSGQKAIDIIRAIPDDAPAFEKYDIIFMDHIMPEMDGIEAVRVIRGEIGTDYARTVPIIALTANAMKGNEETFLSSGFDAFIAKPIDIIQLDRELNRWVGEKEQKMEEEFAALDAGAMEEYRLEGREVEGVDLAAGVERYAEEDIYLQILQSFVVHTPELLEKMRQVSRETLAEYAIIAHGLKGVSYGICAEAIAKQAQVLESAAKFGDFETICAKNGIFIETVETLISGLNDLLSDI